MMVRLFFPVLVFLLDIGGNIQYGSACSLIDDVFCDYFAIAKARTCQHLWAKENCKNMCGHACMVKDQEKESKEKPTKMDCLAADHFRCRDYHHDHDADYYCRQSWMQNNCRHFCGSCQESPAERERLIRPAKKEKRIEKEEDEAPKQDCSKKDHARCPDYKGYSDHYCQQLWMQINCQHFCGECGAKAQTLDPFRRASKESKTNGYLVPGIREDSLVKSQGCEEHDNWRCFVFHRVKYHVCHFDWMSANCKYMCGTCITEKHVHYHYERLTHALQFLIGNQTEPTT